MVFINSILKRKFEAFPKCRLCYNNYNVVIINDYKYTI